MSKRIVFISGGVLLAVAAVIAWLFVSGRVEIAFKNPSSNVGTRTQVCGPNEIEEYNQVFESSSLEQYNDRFDNISQKVEGLSDHKSDPTCAYMLFSFYLNKENNTSKAREYLTILQELARQGQYAITELSDIQSLSASKSSLESREAANTEDADDPSAELPGEAGQGRG